MTHEIPALIRSKNRCLEKMIEATLGLQAKLRSSDDDLAELLFHFNRTRNHFETLMKRIDVRVLELSEKAEIAKQLPQWREQLSHAFEENDMLSKQLLDIDDKFLTEISEKVSSFAKELNSSRKTKQLLGKFKSTWVSRSGEELDQKL